MELIWGFQVSLDEIERPNWVIEDEMSSLRPFMKTGGGGEICFVISWLNITRLSLPHFSTFVKSLVRSEAEVLRYGEILE